jgi:hypothetical protein
VIATAEAQVPADVLGPRLASLYAREEARLAALTLALERRGEVAWSDGVNDSNAGALLPQLEANTWIDEVSDQESGLDGTQQLLREPTRVRATVTYPTVAVDSQPEEPGLNAEPAPAIELDRDVQREMEEEAREEATIALRETLSRTEVSPGVTLSRWMEMQSIEPQALDRILRRARTVRMDHEIDRSQSLGICEVELDFDTGSLNRLR